MCNKVIDVEAELIEENYMPYDIDRKVWQILWDAIMTPYGFGNGGRKYDNDVFEHRPYSWNDDDGMINDYHFHHKPSGLKIQWYKYPLRGALCNMEITDNQFVDVLYDCVNSLQDMMPIKIIHDREAWWDLDGESET